MFSTEVPARRVCATFTRVDIGARVAGIVTSDKLTLVSTHYLAGRRWMCLGESCPLCEVISNSRVYGYFAYARASGSKHDWETAAARHQERILELPHIACSRVEEFINSGYTLLGTPYYAVRFSEKRQSPVEIQFADYAVPLQVGASRVDVEEALLTLHGYPAIGDYESKADHVSACLAHVENDISGMSLPAGGGHLGGK